MENEMTETAEQIKERIIRASVARHLAEQKARRDARKAQGRSIPETAGQIEARWASQPGAIYGGRRILTTAERRAFAQREQDEEDGIARGR